MKSNDYYNGNDIVDESADYLKFVVSATFVDIDNVKKVVFTGEQLREMMIDQYSEDGVMRRDEFGAILINIRKDVIRSRGSDGLKRFFVELVENYRESSANKFGKFAFKSIHFNQEGFVGSDKAYTEAKKARVAEFRMDAEQHWCMEDFSEKLKSAIHDKAWSDGHSGGLHEVINCYEGYVEVADIALESMVSKGSV